MEKLKLIEKLAESCRNMDLCLDEDEIVVHENNSEDADPIIAPWLYIQDVAINIGDDGGYKYLDFHDEENPIFFRNKKECLDYIEGSYAVYGLMQMPENVSISYIIGYLRTGAEKYQPPPLRNYGVKGGKRGCRKVSTPPLGITV